LAPRCFTDDPLACPRHRGHWVREVDHPSTLDESRVPSESTAYGTRTSNGSDYEQLGYDSAGNVTSRRLRDGQSIGFTFDALNRLASQDLPNTALYEYDKSFAYDNLGQMVSASDGWGQVLSFTYDALGRNLSQSSNWYGTKSSAFDLAGRRIRLTWKDGFYVTYDHLVTGETAHIRENGATSGVGVLATFDYDDLGRRASLTRGNGTSSNYSYDAASRLSQLALAFPADTAANLTLGFAYNPASQIVSNTRSNDLYAWTGHGSGTTSSTANGLNQLASLGTGTPGYDSKGNMTSDTATSYAYASDNRMVSGAGLSMIHDPLGRLIWVQNQGRVTDYSGAEVADELAVTTYAIQRRFVYGPGTDEPLVWYEGSGTSDRRFLHADERGSIVAASNSAGAVTSVNTYDEYGKPGSGNVGRFQYTGQKWIAELGLYDYKARMYHPGLGRFLQPDPIGYDGGMNMHAYVKSDPINRSDPSGLHYWCVSGRFTDSPEGCDSTGEEELAYQALINDTIVVTGSRCPRGRTCFDSKELIWISRTDSGVYQGETPSQQMRNCSSNSATRRALNDRNTRSAIGETLSRSYADPPPTVGFWEHGFWTAEKQDGSGVHAFGVYTDRIFNELYPAKHLPWGITQWWYGTGTPNVFFHSHDGEPLSQADIDFATGQKVSIVAVNRSGEVYCYPG
jgi:RHS repeat-associated protein